MARASNVLIGIANIVLLLASFGAIGASIYFHVHGGTDCQKVLQQPLLYTGIGFFVMSVLGIIGGCCKARWAMCLYTVLMFSVMIGLIVFTVLVITVTNKGVGKAISHRGFKEYRLGDYSHWLQKYVVNGNNWDEIKSCLIDAQVCRNIGSGGRADLKASDFYKLNLSPTQSGCCKPPTYCGFEYKNATFWEVPKSGPAVPDSDCTTWNNDQAKLCYDCKSCKGGVLANIKKEWRHLVIFNSCLFVVITILYSLGYCAYKNNKSDNKYTRYRAYS